MICVRRSESYPFLKWKVSFECPLHACAYVYDIYPRAMAHSEPTNNILPVDRVRFKRNNFSWL